MRLRGGGEGRFLLEIMEYNRSLGFVVIFFFFWKFLEKKKEIVSIIL